MSYIYHQPLQIGKYKGLAEGLIEAAMISQNKISHRGNRALDDSTEISNELGTTDKAVGDATAEVMITTPGKIPNEMFYMEETTVDTTTIIHTIQPKLADETTVSHLLTSQSPVEPQKFNEHSTIFLSLLIALLVILLLCCSTACFIAKKKRKSALFASKDVECEPECSGLSQPLLATGKASEHTSKSSCPSKK